MSSPWRTGPKIGGLEALPEIAGLAAEMLTVEQLERADEMAMTLLTRRKQRRQVQWELIRMIPLKPSRPLMYLNPIIMQLPNATRDVIRYLGDYVDLITKEMTYEFLNGKARFSSLGINAKKLEGATSVPRDLVDKLQRYNSFLYTPGKHDFSLPPEGRKHGFTCKEAVLTIYASIELGERIKAVSKLAREAVEKDNLYMIGGRWGPHRVKYAGES
jgi:hypothetical protein